MSNKQTAVEWLINELSKTRDYQRVINQVNQGTTYIRDVIEESKAMEKQQIMDADAAGFRDGCLWSEGEEIYFKSPEHYYEYTYGKGDTE